MSNQLDISPYHDIYVQVHMYVYTRTKVHDSIQLKCVLLLYNVREHIAILDVLGDLLKTLNGVNFLVH